MSENRRGKVSNITIGGIAVHDPEVVFYKKAAGADKEQWDLRVGNPFLKDFVVTIDYQRHVMTLVRP